MLDEHLRGPLWRAIQWHNRTGIYCVDVVHVGDPADLSLGIDDRALLAGAEREERILVTQDRDTMAHHLADPGKRPSLPGDIREHFIPGSSPAATARTC